MGRDSRFQDFEAMLSAPAISASTSKTGELVHYFFSGYYGDPSRFSQTSTTPEIEALLVKYYRQIDQASRQWLLPERRTYHTKGLFDLIREDIVEAASTDDQLETQKALKRQPLLLAQQQQRDKELEGTVFRPPPETLAPAMRPKSGVQAYRMLDGEDMLKIVQNTKRAKLQALTKALLKTNQPNIENDLVDLFDKLPPPSQADIALFLARRGDERGVAAMERLLGELPSAAHLADQSNAVLAVVRALAESGNSAAYAAIRSRLIWNMRQPADAARDQEVDALSHALSGAPPEVHIDLNGIEPPRQPLSATADTALQDLIKGRAATEALVTEMSTGHLQKLISHNDVAAVRIYIARGFDLHSVELGRMHPAMLTMLLRGGADPNVRSLHNNTPLHLLCEEVGGTPESVQERVELVSALISANADVNARNEGGVTPLMFAVQNKQADIVRTLLQHGADASAVDKKGRTAMQIAIGLGSGGKDQAQSSAKLQELLRDGGAGPELMYRLRMAPILEPVLSVVAAALVMLAFGWLAGKKGLLGRVHWAIVWPLYFISGSAVTALSLMWWRSPHPGGESELGGYLLTAGFILQALCLLFAAGLFLVGLQIGTPRVSRQRAEGSHRMP